MSARGDANGSVQLRAFRIQLLREPRTVLSPRVIRGAEDAAQLLREYLGSPDREQFVCLALSTKHRPIGLHTVSVGTLSSAPIHPREVFKFAIHVGAAAVIIGHNHPSGDPEPSRDDVAITEQLRSAGRLLGIELLDHIIVTDGGFVSLRETRQGLP